MAWSLDFKLDVIINALASLSHRTTKIEGVMAELHNNGTYVIEPSKAYHAQNYEETILPSIQQDPVVLQRKKPQVSLLDKFDGTHSKCWNFINQIRLITVLQSKCYPTKETRVGFVETLLTGQTLSWFALLFEKWSSILSNFEILIEAFVEAFDEHEKVRWATTKIRSVW